MYSLQFFTYNPRRKKIYLIRLVPSPPYSSQVMLGWGFSQPAQYRLLILYWHWCLSLVCHVLCAYHLIIILPISCTASAFYFSCVLSFYVSDQWLYLVCLYLVFVCVSFVSISCLSHVLSVFASYLLEYASLVIEYL